MLWIAGLLLRPRCVGNGNGGGSVCVTTGNDTRDGATAERLSYVVPSTCSGGLAGDGRSNW